MNINTEGFPGTASVPQGHILYFTPPAKRILVLMLMLVWRVASLRACVSRLKQLRQAGSLQTSALGDDDRRPRTAAAARSQEEVLASQRSARCS